MERSYRSTTSLSLDTDWIPLLRNFSRALVLCIFDFLNYLPDEEVERLEI